MTRTVVAILTAFAWLDGHAQSSESSVRARFLGAPSLDSFYPSSMKRSGIAGAAARVEVCVDAESRVTGDPEVYVSSFNTDWDAAVVKMMKKGRYAAGVVDGKPVPSCVQLAVYGSVKSDPAFEERVRKAAGKAVTAYVSEANKVLPQIDGDLEIKGATYVGGDKIVWKKVFWKITSNDLKDLDLRAMYLADRDKETQIYCGARSFKILFRAGVSVVSWFQTSDGKTMYGIVSNEESCS
jgi:hypothetical protein